MHTTQLLNSTRYTQSSVSLYRKNEIKCSFYFIDTQNSIHMYRETFLEVCENVNKKQKKCREL